MSYQTALRFGININNRDLSVITIWLNHKGDVATLIDYVPHPGNGEQGSVLEIFSATGESIAVVIVPISAIKPLRNDEILSVRLLAEVS